MSKLTIHSSGNDLNHVILDNAKCTFKFMSTLCNGANSSAVIYHENTSNQTTVTYNNGITVKNCKDKVDINFSGNHIEFDSNSDYTVVNNELELTIINSENPITELVLNNNSLYNASPLTLNNRSDYLETISVNTNTIFNNLCAGSKVNTINVLTGKKFEQTENDLYIYNLNLEPKVEIKFTHDGKDYKLINPNSNYSYLNNLAKIHDLYDFVKKAKSFKITKDCLENWSEGHDYHLMASFVVQNQGSPDIPTLGGVIPHD